LGVPGSLENSHDALHDLLQNLDRIGDEHGSERGAADHDDLRRLHQNQQGSFFHQIAGNHCSKDNHNPDDRKHKSFIVLLSRQEPLPDGHGSVSSGHDYMVTVFQQAGAERSIGSPEERFRCVAGAYDRPAHG
jgi:hypothetical protein